MLLSAYVWASDGESNGINMLRLFFGLSDGDDGNFSDVVCFYSEYNNRTVDGRATARRKLRNLRCRHFLTNRLVFCLLKWWRCRSWRASRLRSTWKLSVCQEIEFGSLKTCQKSHSNCHSISPSLSRMHFRLKVGSINYFWLIVIKRSKQLCWEEGRSCCEPRTSSISVWETRLFRLNCHRCSTAYSFWLSRQIVFHRVEWNC